MGNLSLCVVAGCYKRTDIAERMLDSVQEHLPFVKSAVIYLQGVERYTPKKRPGLDVIWSIGPQLPPNLARGAGVKVAMREFSPDLVCIADDDVVYTQFSSLVEGDLEFAMQPLVGVVAITRQMKKEKHTWDNTLFGVIKEQLPYIGGGWIIEPWKIEKVGFLPDDSADERAFGLKLFLAGFENYRTRNAYAIHDQGRKFDGGLKQAMLDEHAGNGSVKITRRTSLLTSEYINVGKDYYNAGKKDNALETVSAGYSFTEKAKKIHEKNRSELCRL